MNTHQHPRCTSVQAMQIEAPICHTIQAWWKSAVANGCFVAGVDVCKSRACIVASSARFIGANQGWVHVHNSHRFWSNAHNSESFNPCEQSIRLLEPSNLQYSVSTNPRQHKAIIAHHWSSPAAPPHPKHNSTIHRAPYSVKEFVFKNWLHTEWFAKVIITITLKCHAPNICCFRLDKGQYTILQSNHSDMMSQLNSARKKPDAHVVLGVAIYYLVLPVPLPLVCHRTPWYYYYYM